MSSASTSGANAPVVALAATMNDGALAELVAAYHDRVYRFGRRVCRDGFDADDAVQEAFTKLARRPDVMADRSALSWLMSVVRRTCRRMLRPFWRQQSALGEPVEADAVAVDAMSPELAREKFELVHAVQTAIASLPAPYREVIILRDLEGLSGEETCRALRLELATMKSRLHRARALLRERIERDGALALDRRRAAHDPTAGRADGT
jgi:RNA polymerase sigma-70 factor (ECF subfamily)